MSTTDAIRAYASEHVIFGSDEIREKHGEKAALLVSRLAAKGMFVRIRNGVFGPEGADESHEAYQTYLERIHAARVERSKLPGATMADRFFAWAAEFGPFTVGQATSAMEQDMKSYVSSYFRAGKLDRPSEGRYLYEGPRPAVRRTSKPMAEDDGPDHAAVLAAISGRVATAASVAETTGLDPHRIRAVLARLVADGRLSCEQPTSSARHAAYRIPGDAIKLSEEALSLLAIMASTGSIGAREASTHKIGDSVQMIQDLVGAGLAERDGDDARLGGAAYAPTAAGLDLLRSHGLAASGLPELHRPFERSLLRVLMGEETLTSRKIHERLGCGSSLNRVESVMLRLLRAGAVEAPEGKPARYSITALGRSPFLAPDPSS